MMSILIDWKVLKYVPKCKRAAIRDAYHDEDGYWIHLNPGWRVKDYFAEQTIHEDTIAELREVIKRIV